MHDTHREDAMKPQRIYDESAPKRPVNLTANSELVSLAKKANINLSQAFEEAILSKVRLAQEQQWLEENKEGIAAYNERIARNGIFGASKRRF
jgi:antitoxin CcdA